MSPGLSWAILTWLKGRWRHTAASQCGGDGCPTRFHDCGARDPKWERQRQRQACRQGQGEGIRCSEALGVCCAGHPAVPGAPPGSFRSSLFQAISVTATVSAIALCEDGPVRVARVPERSNYYGMDRCHLRDVVTTSDTDNLPEGMVQLVNDMVEGSGKGTNHCGTRVGLIQNCKVRCLPSSCKTW